MNHYLNVFIEAMWTASIFPMSYDATFDAMRLFGGFKMPKAAAIAIIGATIGQLCNWTLGRTLFTIRHKAHFNISERVYAKTAHIFNTYLVFLLLFSWLPIGNILLCVAGFTKAPLKLVTPLIFTGYCYYYLIDLL